MQSAYSWMGTRLHLVLEDDLADAYNRAQDAFELAQKAHKERTGVQWNPDEKLWITWTKKESEAWDGVAGLVNHLIDLNGGALDIPEEEMTSYYLVKL